jgi:long-chain acyl-CoA synthetase
MGSVQSVFGHHFIPGHTYLGYLPLAHVLEFLVELCALYMGVTIGYASPKTLTDSSVRNCPGDLRAFRPSIMFGVPSVFETIRKGVLAKVAEGGWVKSAVLDWAVALKKAEIPFVSGFVDRKILSNVRAATGGNIKILMSGGASISYDTQEWMSLTVASMIQGGLLFLVYSYFQFHFYLF